MRCLTLILSLLANAGWAHPGHIVDVAGHGHWVGAAAIGLAVLVGLWGKLKDRDVSDSDAEEAETQDEATA